MIVFIKKFLIGSFAFLFLLGSSDLWAQTVAEKFSGFDPDSKIKVNHDPLTTMLQATVLPVGRSYRILGNESPDEYRGSRIKTAKSLSPSRFEGSRLFVHAFADGHKLFFKGYQEGLERLTQRRSLSELNKDEQLAFWLNLYNVIVINKLVEEYPIQSLQSLRSTKRGKISFWDEKVTTIEGVSLSLKDIETIIFTNFNLPEAAFGLWQGSIGGPRLLNYAFTGSNITRALQNNASEFVNSNRGLRPPSGSQMSVSEFYEWMMPAFGTSEGNVLSFIRTYADPNFVEGVDRVSSLKFKVYDWMVADLLGGAKHTGQHLQLGGALAAHGGGKTSPSSWGLVASFTPSEGGGGIAGYNANAIFDLAQGFTPAGPLEIMPQNIRALIEGIRINNRQPTPLITTTECAPGDECIIENLGRDDDN